MTSSSCDLANVCQTCNALEAPWECCYWDSKNGGLCRFHGSSFHVGHSKLTSHSWASALESSLSKAENIVSSVRLSSQDSFPSPFIPEVKLGIKNSSRALAIIRETGVPIIAVSLGEFYNGTRELARLRVARTLGMRRLLHFDGQVLLTTDVPDELCEHFLRHPEALRDTVKCLNPDFVTTPDTSCYHNIPAAISLYNICRAVIATGYLVDVNAKVVGLALGSNTNQLLQHARSLIKMGCKILAVPLYEFRRLGLHQLARHRVTLLRRDSGAKTLALSCSPWRGERLILADYYSSWSWFPFSSGASSLEEGVLKLNRFLQRCREHSSQEVFA